MDKNNELLENLKQAQYGTHIVIPLKGDYSNDLCNIEKDIKKSVFNKSLPETFFESEPVSVNVLDNDLNEITNKLFECEYNGRIAAKFAINKRQFIEHCFRVEDCNFFVGTPSKTFDITKVILYIFNTGVAFLVFHFKYLDISTMRDIFNPSCVKLKNQNILYYSEDGEAKIPICLKYCIQKVLEGTNFSLFFPLNAERIFSDAYAVSVAVIPERIKDISDFKRIAYNLQRMQALEYDGFSEDSIHASLFTYPNQKNNSYQWCSCVGDCSISRVRCGDTLDRQIDDFRVNSMALIILALYQKYSCLLFSERLRIDIRKGKRNFDSLENEMIDFKAFGKVDISSVSRVANIRKFYQQVLEINGVNEAVIEIDEKLKVIAEHEREKGESKINAIMIILSLFSVVSILADMIAVIQSVSSGGKLEYSTVLFTIGGIVSIATIAVLFNRKR